KYSTYMLQGLPIDGFVDPMSMESMAFQRIEVQRGPASVLYPNYLSQDFAGNQCPLAGTINLIPKENISAPRSMFSLNYGSYQTINGQLYHEQKFGKTKAFAGCSYEKSNYTNYGSTGSWLNMQKNPEYQKGKIILGVSASVDQAEKHKISLFGNYTFHQGDVGQINREYNNNYGLINVSYSGELSKPVSISFKAGLRTYDRSWQEDHFSSNNDPSLRETDGVKQTIIPLDLSLSYSHLKKGKLMVGADHQQSNYRTTSQLVNQEKITGNDASASQTGLYFQEELSFGKLIVRGGGRYNFIAYDIKKFSGSTPGLSHRSWNVFLWSAGIKYHLTEEWSVFTNAGSSFMSPGLKSMGGTLSENDRLVSGKNGQLPNPNLNPEKGIGFDLGIEGKLLQSIDLSLRAFSNQIKNAIIDNVVSQNPSQTMSVNTDGKTDVKGFEIGASQPIGNHFEWFANITFSDSKINDPTNPDQDGAEVPFVPRVMGNAGFSLSLPLSIEITPMAHWGGKIYDSSSKASRTAFSSKELINVKVVKNFSAKNKSNFSLFADIYNLTNNRFEMPWQFRDPGLSFMLG
ncbi:MAG TPA: TonB-dependent receptor, partial [Prolixibacteraceae bacterium]|nr:TonB-dependent receptor [Prolixibacteraceae bacterium]